MTETEVPGESPRILISYRRDDSSGYAGHLFDKLSTALGPRTLFMDIDGIPPGADFVEEIKKAVASSHVLIAIIGRNWLDIRDQEGKRRLSDPTDFVRLEIATALQRGILVIPTLVQDARMPREKDLPPDLKPLARRQAIEISDTRFNQDVERLIAVIRDSGAIPGLPAALPVAGRTTVQGRFAWRQVLPFAAVLAVGLTVWGVWTMRDRTRGSAEGVTEPPVVQRFAAEPSRFIQRHVDGVRLTWAVEGAAEISLAPLGAVDAKGSSTVPAPTQDTTYALRARNRLGDTSARVTVDVMSLDEFIAVDAPSPETQAALKTWVSEYLRALEEVGYLPDLRGVMIAIEPGLLNAYFDGRKRQIVIGQPLARDRDVVLREYTHLMLTGSEFRSEGDIDPLSTPDGRAIESGLADYFPASALGDPKIGEVSGPILAKRPFIRTLINSGTFDRIRAEDPPQVAGETWGGAFWDMRLAMGRAKADPLLLSAWRGVGAGGAAALRRGFVDKLIELASAADASQADQIRRVLRERRFPF